MGLKKTIQDSHFPFWLLTAAVLMGFILPILIMDGMFMDGLLYATVSKNLANGNGSLWFLRFSDYGFAENLTFHEHPPLVFWIQSIFYKVLGNSIYVERIYSFLTAIVTAFLMVKTWRLVTKGDENLAKMSWLSIILWIIIPVSYWAFQNNLQENTMGIFSLLSVYFVLKAVHLEKKVWVNLMLAGVMIFSAAFSKGVPGFFTLGTLFIHWIIFRKQGLGKMLIQSLFVGIIALGILGLILLNPSANESLSIYFYERLGGRVNSAHLRESHFYILGRIFWELLPLMIICAITLLIFRLKKIDFKLKGNNIKWIVFFMLIGFSGSVPIMLTLVQKSFYFCASLPYFGIAFALLIAPGLADRIAKIKHTSITSKIFTAFMLLGIVTVLAVTINNSSKMSRDYDELNDAYLIEEIIPHNSNINFHPLMHNEWDMRIILMRYFEITADVSTERSHPYYLMQKDLGLKPDSAYVKIDLPTVKYDLYERKSQ
jgi:4-amino-4-deoxy-L-arabinose transferase-like glycosyltransferase